MTLSTTQKTIEELLTGNRQYQIPDFQRPYVWEEQQAIALVNDLLDAWRTNDGDYFLGSIVLVDHPGGDNVDVIDGQQRLTTLCILVALLRHLAGTDAGLHDEIGQLLSIPESRIKGLDERPRLSVRECDRYFFDTFIVGDNIDSLLDVEANSLTPTSVRRIHDNARAMLDALIDPEVLPPQETQNFVQYLMLQVSLIEVTTDSYQAAHRIFSVLNTRGVPLAATDIFKARVLSHVAPAKATLRSPLGGRHQLAGNRQPRHILRAPPDTHAPLTRKTSPHRLLFRGCTHALLHDQERRAVYRRGFDSQCAGLCTGDAGTTRRAPRRNPAGASTTLRLS